jgi:hypothetical protein
MIIKWVQGARYLLLGEQLIEYHAPKSCNQHPATSNKILWLISKKISRG